MSNSDTFSFSFALSFPGRRQAGVAPVVSGEPDIGNNITCEQGVFLQRSNARQACLESPADGGFAPALAFLATGS